MAWAQFNTQPYQAMNNPAFPTGYQPAWNPQTYQQQQMGQTMTPPTIRAEIVQVDGEEQAAQYPVGAGASQMMIAKDDSAIFVKTAGQNGTTLDVFVKRPPAPPAPEPDFCTREEVEAMIAAALPKRPAKKEAEA